MEESWRRLAARAPRLAERVAAARVPASYAIASAPGGEPVLTACGVPLQNLVDPAADARRWARDAMDRLEAIGAEHAVVVGLGLGYHVEALAERFAGRITVVEPDPAIWRLALESRDLAKLLARVDLDEGDGEPSAAGPAATGRARVLAWGPSLLLPGGEHRRAVERWQASAALSGSRLRILVVSPLYGGSWPIAGFAARALARLGHEVRLLDLSPFHSGLERLGELAPRRLGRARLESGFCDLLGEGVAATVEAGEPDVVLALAQAPLQARALEQIGRLGAVRVLWFVEDFRRFTYWREVAAHYDHVFTIQDGECVAAISATTEGRVSYLPCAFEPTVHRPCDLSEDERVALASDLSFVGAGYRNRRLALRMFLDCDLRIWGSDWEGAAYLERVVQRSGARISTEDAVRIFNATSVNLNLHSSTYHDGVDPEGDFVNPRTFELAGCGAFQVVDRRRLLAPLFSAGDEIAVADSAEEMKALALHYLARPEERRAMAERARARALAEHTYGHRMQALLGAVVESAQERLLGRGRAATVGDARRLADGDLAAFLARLDASAPFALTHVANEIHARDGQIDDAEAIFLFLEQFDDLYLAEHRA